MVDEGGAVAIREWKMEVIRKCNWKKKRGKEEMRGKKKGGTIV